MPEPVPKAVYEGLNAVRLSGTVNMLDTKSVIRLLEELDYPVAARFVRENREAYSRGIFHGFEVRKGRR